MTDGRTNNKAAQRRRTQEERRSETSGRLLDVTIDLLEEKGYSRLRIADAAARAGLSRGGQTHHFATKNDLVEAAIERVFESEVSLAQTEAGASGDGDIVRHSARHVEEFLSGKLYRVSLNMLISAGTSGPIVDRVRAISARNRTLIEDAWIDRLAPTGLARKDAEAALSLLWSVQRGIAVERAIEGRQDDARDVVDFAVELVSDHLGTERNSGHQARPQSARQGKERSNGKG